MPSSLPGCKSGPCSEIMYPKYQTLSLNKVQFFFGDFDVPLRPEVLTGGCCLPVKRLEKGGTEANCLYCDKVEPVENSVSSRPALKVCEKLRTVCNPGALLSSYIAILPK